MQEGTGWKKREERVRRLRERRERKRAAFSVNMYKLNHCNPYEACMLCNASVEIPERHLEDAAAIRYKKRHDPVCPRLLLSLSSILGLVTVSQCFLSVELHDTNLYQAYRSLCKMITDCYTVVNSRFLLN